MIPVLVIPTYNRPDLLERALRSIDVPVERLLIVDNGKGYVRYLGSEEDALLSRLNATIWRPPYEGIGYGGGINFGITQNPTADWWMWSSNDVEFHPGTLASVARRMNEAKGPRAVTGGFTWGAVNPILVDMVGLVDDWSFFPIYFDDNDYHRRCLLAGVEWIDDGTTGITHGAEGHQASLTIRSDQEAARSNNRSFQQNAMAYLDKWGGLPGRETFDTPWNSGMPVWVTKPDINGRIRRRW